MSKVALNTKQYTESCQSNDLGQFIFIVFKGSEKGCSAGRDALNRKVKQNGCWG